jgi:hypothetical protein
MSGVELLIAGGQPTIVNFIDFGAISYYHYTGCYSVFLSFAKLDEAK